jgi:hypothetical protein
MTRIALTAALIAAGLVLGGCSGSHGRSTAARSANARATLVLRQLAGCIRGHGLPSFPDPVTGRNGVPAFPDSAPDVPPAAQSACRPVIARMPPNYTSTTAVSTADFQKLLALARCIRARGVPDWPDPNALGEFPIDTRVQQGGKQLFVPAVHACARLNPDPNGGVNVIRAHR